MKRYWHPEHCSDDSDAVTLIMAHGTGLVKEHWEPTLEYLYDMVGGGAVKIREAWSIEASNHGDSAALNQDVLSWGYTPVCESSCLIMILLASASGCECSVVVGWEEYARSIHAFLAGLGTGVNVDFSTRNLVGVGHSMGATTMYAAALVGAAASTYR